MVPCFISAEARGHIGAFEAIDDRAVGVFNIYGGDICRPCRWTPASDRSPRWAVDSGELLGPRRGFSLVVAPPKDWNWEE